MFSPLRRRDRTLASSFPTPNPIHDSLPLSLCVQGSSCVLLSFLCRSRITLCVQVLLATRVFLPSSLLLPYCLHSDISSSLFLLSLGEKSLRTALVSHPSLEFSRPTRNLKDSKKFSFSSLPPPPSLFLLAYAWPCSKRTFLPWGPPLSNLFHHQPAVIYFLPSL